MEKVVQALRAEALSGIQQYCAWWNTVSMVKIHDGREKLMIPDDDPGMQLVHLLRAVTMELELFGAAFATERGLHATDLRALIQLLDAQRADLAATPGWLGQQLGLNSASVTALVDRLELAGHVRRARDAQDRRRVLLVVEPSAIALGWSFFGPLMARMVTAMRQFDEAELAAIRRFLVAMAETATDVRRGSA